MTRIKIYNTLSKTKETFTPQVAGQVSMYACGLTPQNHPHLGHALAAIRFGTIREYLKYKGYSVIYVENVTDIDDKIINRSRELGVPPDELAERYFTEYRNAKIKLGVTLPSHEPKVTEFIDEIIVYVQALIEKGFAYSTADGDVYFDVDAKLDYGKLSGRKVVDQKSGVRVAVEGNKKNDYDFALWKKDDTPEVSWDSPWGKGRPGWHIECSVMSNQILGDTIDIHCGGLDLVFPHHENEIAQCEAHNGKTFVQYWVHCGLLNVDGRKMSKTFGNFLTIDDALEKYGRELIRFVILRHHYRSSIDFNDKLFLDNIRSLHAFYLELGDLVALAAPISYEEDAYTRELVSSFEECMNDDFNTATALVVLTNFLDKAAALSDEGKAEESINLKKCIVHLGRLFGLFDGAYSLVQLKKELLHFHQAAHGFESPLNLEDIEHIVLKRKTYRANKDFMLSDQLRDQLKQNGISALDNNPRYNWDFA